MPRGRVLCAALAVAAIAATTAYAAATFAESDVRVLHQWDGAQPGANFAWAVSALGDIESKRGADLIVGEPFSATGSAYVYESRNGRPAHRFDGAPGDWLGFAIADAGDVNGDRGNDILVGAPANGAGYVDLYSGHNGKLLHRFVGESEGDFFGWAVSSAGDVDLDGRPDILVGASVFSQDARPGFATSIQAVRSN